MVMQVYMNEKNDARTVEVMEAGKALGLYNVTVECLMKGGATEMKWLVKMFTVCSVSSVAPID